MSVLHKKAYHDLFSTSAELPSSYELFAKAERRVAAKKELIADMDNELTLLRQQAFNTYKEQIEYLDFPDSLLESASTWHDWITNGVDANGNKINKRKKYDERLAYDNLVKHIQWMLNIDKIKITQLSDYCWGEATSIEFNYKNQTYCLRIPCIPNIRLHSYLIDGPSCFKLQLYHVTDIVHNYIGATFDEDEMAAIFSKYITELEESDFQF